MSLIGGLGLFLYGMQITSDGLQRAADARLKSILEVLTNNKIVAVLLGTVITVLLQSSGATTVMLVGLVSASLMGLEQTIGVMLGAGLGTTLTVQLIAFNVTDYSLLFIGVGSLMILAAGSSRRSLNKQRVLIIKYVGQVLLGFGLIFFGMHIMTQALTPLRSNPYFVQVLLDLEDKHFLGVLAATVFTGLIHSSAATIGLTLTLANQGLITLDSALPLVPWNYQGGEARGFSAYLH
jgi:phosphate:Na+ symporter